MSRKLTAAVLVGALVLTGTTGAHAQSTVAAESVAAEVSTEAVLGAAFFGVGPLAEGDLRAVASGEVSQEDWDALGALAVEQLIAHDPAAADQIAADLTSGSPLLVNQAIDDATVLANGAFDLDEAEDPLEGGDYGAAWLAAVFAAVLSTAVAQNTAAVTTVAAVTQAVWRWNGIGSAGESLEREQAVAILTEQLAV